MTAGYTGAIADWATGGWSIARETERLNSSAGRRERSYFVYSFTFHRNVVNMARLI